MPDAKRLTLRLPAELHHLVMQRADADHRSLNREIEFLLWQVFQVDADAFANTRNTVRRASDSPSPGRPVSPSATRASRVRTAD
jgi:hypothetical protein